MAGSTTFSSTPSHRGPCRYNQMLGFSTCRKCALVNAGYLGKAGFLEVDQMKGEEIDHAYRQMMETEREKEKEAKKEMNEQRMNAYVWKKWQEEKQQQKEEREQRKKTHTLNMHGLTATYPTPTATSSYQLRKSPGVKADIGQQGYQKSNICRGTAVSPHDIFSSASQVVMARPPKASPATTGKPPPKQLHPINDPQRGRR